MDAPTRVGAGTRTALLCTAAASHWHASLPPLRPWPRQSWAAFKRALDIDPEHGLSRKNKKELVGFLSASAEGKRIMKADDPHPPPRPPRKREHQVSEIPRVASVAMDTAWWRAPFILTETRGRRRRELKANSTPLEEALRQAFPGARAEHSAAGRRRRPPRRGQRPISAALWLQGPRAPLHNLARRLGSLTARCALRGPASACSPDDETLVTTSRYYPGGMVHAGAKPTFVPLESGLSRVRGVAGRVAKAYLQFNLSPERWASMLDLAGVKEPSFVAPLGEARRGGSSNLRARRPCTRAGARRAASRTPLTRLGPKNRSAQVAPGPMPGRECHAAVERAGQSSNFELDTHWRMLIMGGGAGAGMFLHADTLRTSSWQLQIRGSKRWHLCPGPGGPQAAAHTYCGAAVLDAFDPDYRKCEAFKNAKCLGVPLSCARPPR